MRKWTTALFAALLVATLAAPAVATPTSYEFDMRLVDTLVFGIPADQVVFAPGDDPGTNWLSGDVWHVRRVPVNETMESLDGTTEYGTLDRAFNFNWDLSTGASTAWCSWTMTFTNPDLGTFSGHCGGDLYDGIIVGNGEFGHLSGTYELEAGGVVGAGPYLVNLEILGT